MADAVAVARQLKNWAIQNQIIASYGQAPPVNDEVIRSMLGSVGVPIAAKILQERKISYIAVDKAANKVIVFVQRKLTRRHMDLFAHAGLSDVAIEFQEGGHGEVGPDVGPPEGVPPFHEHNGRYTCGSSVYIGSDKGAGTLGCLVRDNAGTLYGLSNNHVTGGANYASPGLPIVAPGMIDVAAGGRDPETLGHHFKAYPFIDGLPTVVDATGNIDAATFRLSDPDRVTSMQRDFYDTPSAIKPLAVGMHVQKVGRTTGRTSGVVIGDLFDPESVMYIMDMGGLPGRKAVFFNGLYAIKSDHGVFAGPGDSGSIITVLDEERNRFGCGLVVAGDGKGLTLALSLDRVLDYFDVSLVSGHNI